MPFIVRFSKRVWRRLFHKKLIQKISNHGERVVDLYKDGGFIAHLSIYHFALAFVRGKTVLDFGSGTGYGSEYLLRNGASSVFGIDIDPQSVEYSKKKYSGNGLKFAVGDLGRVPLEPVGGGVFDVVYSSNVLEHIKEIRGALANIVGSLHASGQAIIAVPPIVDENSRRENIDIPFHLLIWSPRQWFAFLGEYFEEVRCVRHILKKGADEAKVLRGRPEETTLGVDDFEFIDCDVRGLGYEQPTISAIFVCGTPKRPDLLPPLAAPVAFVDESFTKA